MDVLAFRITKLLKEQKITRYKMAKDFKCSKSTIINWCDGVNEPKATQIRDIAIYFNVSADYLLGLEDESGTHLEIKNSYNIINNSNGKITLK